MSIFDTPTPATVSFDSSSAEKPAAPEAPPVIGAVEGKPDEVLITNNETGQILGRFQLRVESVEGEGSHVWIEDTEKEDAKVLPGQISPALETFDVYFDATDTAKNLHASLITDLEAKLSKVQA